MTDSLEFHRIDDLPLGTDWVGECELPDIPGVSMVAKIADALDHATSQRKGLAVLAIKGEGKSDAFRAQRRAFEHLQKVRSKHDGHYKRQRLLVLRTLTAETYRDALVVIMKTVLGPERAGQPGLTRAKNDDLRMELVRALLNGNYVAIVLDEAEKSKAPVFELLRDIMNDAYEADPKREQTKNGRIPAGVGILLLGTPEMKSVLDKSSEAGHRWSQAIEEEPCSAALAPVAYATWFPGFADHITTIGEEPWANYIASTATRGARLTLRHLEDHARRYIRRVAREYPEITTREQIPFVRELFEYTRAEAYSVVPTEGKR